MNAGDRKSCNANKISISTRPPMCHSRPRLKHSRAGYSGNPYSTSLRGERASLEDSYPAHAQWIPAFAGMTGWPSGWPRARATSGISPFTLSAGTPITAMARGRRLASSTPYPCGCQDMHCHEAMAQGGPMALGHPGPAPHPGWARLPATANPTYALALGYQQRFYQTPRHPEHGRAPS